MTHGKVAAFWLVVLTALVVLWQHVSIPPLKPGLPTF